MKKLILLLAFTTVSFSQTLNTFWIGGDIKNNIVGSLPTNNKASLDLIFGLGIVSNGMEFNISGESFSKIDFLKFAFSIGKVVKINKTLNFVPAVEYTNIMRNNNWGGALSQNKNLAFHSLALNLSLRRQLTDNISLELMTNILPRTDIWSEYNDLKIVSSNYLKIVYVIERN